ncbi:hypothetical protein J6590_078550 [Homalodisca vitripennis]|nr:hypothetical protein J6590_078550 [Homalodisca vitripennis]
MIDVLVTARMAGVLMRAICVSGKQATVMSYSSPAYLLCCAGIRLLRSDIFTSESLWFTWRNNSPDCIERQ